ncbi:carbohydrate ABC transporter permease [Cohnella silvisoli]|uniref:Carbohydrate ABC transporter permease n=1 Tax=Cohnella silvisoli TaxID=2873699 RepID=A0ABV1L446_9BACL|nr:carbohydrate ABC transporter permease [Cohnella silvisoli]MCD9026411.1 carbohydrate ABC transporter permease [Cohnella silvisoli]
MRRIAARPDNRAGLLTELAMIVVALLFLYPVFYLFAASFKKPEDFYNPLKLPDSFYWGHYAKAFDKVDVWAGFLNTAFISCGALALTIGLTSMAGYAIGRRPQKTFQFILYFLLSGMVIPIQTNMIPLFQLGVDVHLIDTRTFLVLLYTAGTIPFATFLYAGFTKTIPRELEEAADIDGCGRFRTFWSIIFPLLLPATGTVIIINILSYWNDLFTPLLYLKDPDKMTLMPQILQFKANNQSVDYGPIFALSAMATLPLIVLFVFTQKYMIKGMVVGSMKG